jgi:hypothetical protein
LQFIFFLHLVALMSLLVKRGGLPLAFAAYYFGGSAGSILFMLPLMIRGPGSMEIFIFVAGGISLGLIALLQWAIGARLTRLAHQE